MHALSVRAFLTQWRRLVRFRVRTLILVVIVACLWNGWLVQVVRTQRRAVEAIRRAEGAAYYNWECTDQSLIPDASPWAPAWLVDRIGEDYFGHVKFVTLFDESPDALLIQVGQLSQLEVLDLGACHDLTDRGLTHLSGLKNLRTLILNGSSLSDAGLEQLSGFRRLRYLRVGECQITDRGLAHLKDLRRLEDLSLYLNEVGATGLANLKSLSSVKSISLTISGADDVALGHLLGLANVVHLEVRGGREVTGGGLRHLKSLTKLRSLVLASVRVSDEALILFSTFPSLEAITFQSTAEVSATQSARLRRAAPRLRIYNTSY